MFSIVLTSWSLPCKNVLAKFSLSPTGKVHGWGYGVLCEFIFQFSIPPYTSPAILISMAALSTWVHILLLNLNLWLFSVFLVLAHSACVIIVLGIRIVLVHMSLNVLSRFNTSLLFFFLIRAYIHIYIYIEFNCEHYIVIFFCQFTERIIDRMGKRILFPNV